MRLRQLGPLRSSWRGLMRDDFAADPTIRGGGVEEDGELVAALSRPATWHDI